MHKRVSSFSFSFFSGCVLVIMLAHTTIDVHTHKINDKELSWITFKQFVQNTIHLQILRIEAQTKKWYTNKTMCHNETCIKTQKLPTINFYALSLLMRHTPNSHFNWFQINIPFGILT
jgi:hypothetical protein